MNDREFLERAEDALHSIALDLIAVSPWLKKPFTDRPELTPWTRSTGRQARRAHDLAMAIRKHLGLPHRWRTSAFGSPPLEIEHVVASAVSAERERIREGLEDITTALARPGLGAGAAHDEHLRVVRVDDLLKLLEGQ